MVMLLVVADLAANESISEDQQLPNRSVFWQRCDSAGRERCLQMGILL